MQTATSGPRAAGTEHRSRRRGLAALIAAAFATTVIGVATAGTAHAGIGPGECGVTATFTTEANWGGTWHRDANLRLEIDNRHTVTGQGGAAAGTEVTWTGPNGNGDIVFDTADSFTGTAQFPGEGPVGYRGTLVSSDPMSCDEVAVFDSDVEWGGTWHNDARTTMLIDNRRTVVGPDAVAADTAVTWTGPNGSGDIVFDTAGSFTGTARFPGEGPVGYRGAGMEVCAVANYRTEARWGGAWHGDAVLSLMIDNRRTVVGADGVATGTAVAWTGPNGNGDIVFDTTDSFTGTAQFPGEGPVGYRGTFERSEAIICADAGYTTEARWGGAWHGDAVLSLVIDNRRSVAGFDGAAEGTAVTWTGPNGNGDIVFDTADSFTGTAQFPGEGPVGYRGTLN
ncbi:hypothetical protein ACN27G_11785 [Plantactinospora sp. WMMB334]|uniref:hypothetical protein n=1 Tax=Plantactinospora sp. WMMB334 TaxID=3404119 RepID=UPI003B953173